ncbi:isoprenylcysteine carboxylmethyltransferase family protein [Desulfosporosinus sp. FKA]|uniref:methyltransferase family protein n=1 Tax=Desulfosporosinus sp. FKA TaxID=1969834 RepID=UPI000B49F215|nr:isoprenylcysteine carboxylmethyltransferase family protein [Desulfosporosinus sp. FKA]
MINLLGRTLAGFLMLIIALAAFIFLPAWTINYLQAWVYLLTFSISVILITLYLFKRDPQLLERRLKAGATAEKEKSQKAIQALANLFFCFVFIFAGLDFRFHWSRVPLNISLLANVFVVLGFYIVFLVFKENSYTSAIIEVDKNQKVISTGPYRLVRHPMYSGAILMMIFSPIALGSYWAVLFVMPLILTIVLRLLDEEKFLSKNLSGYTDYCKKVRYHLIPLLW